MGREVLPEIKKRGREAMMVQVGLVEVARPEGVAETLVVPLLLAELALADLEAIMHQEETEVGVAVDLVEEAWEIAVEETLVAMMGAWAAASLEVETTLASDHTKVYKHNNSISTL